MVLAESHLHGHAHPDVVQRTVGEVDDEPAAALELDHAVDGGRVHGHGQHVSGEGLDDGGHVGELVVLL